MPSDLANRSCVPCLGCVPSLKEERIADLLELLGNGWQAIDHHHLEKVFCFKDFKEALAFTNTVGAIAESENHHPDILTSWGRTTVRIWTHTVDGLTENDFILAAKVEESVNSI